MLFEELTLPGAYLIRQERLADERGFFARTFCAKAFAERGLSSQLAQCNVSFNHRRGILRGLHFQKAPHAEAKLVSCQVGAIYDVLVDLRPASPTYLAWQAVELHGGNDQALYIPEGFAHGFQVLEDNTMVQYLMSNFYVPEAASGLRYDDPRLAIRWPIAEPQVSAKDAAYEWLGDSDRHP